MDTAFADFEARREGYGCVLCDPLTIGNGRARVAGLSASTLYLEHDQTYRGYCLLLFSRRHASGLDALTESERQSYLSDLGIASVAVADCFRPDHMNYAMLGNLVPHLHAHLIPRYRGDPRWGRPIWGDGPPAAPVIPEQAGIDGAVGDLRRALTRAGVAI